MLVELVYSLNSFFTTMPDFSHVSEHAMPMATLFSAAGALILGKFTGNLGGLTLPINFSALFIGAMLSNWLLGGLNLDIDPTIQRPMFISMVGMTFAAFVMMLCVQNERAKY